MPIGFHRVATRRCADGVGPSGVGTLDDRQRLAIPPIFDHGSPRRTAAEGAGRRKTLAGAYRVSPGGALHSSVAVGFHAIDSSSLWYSASLASEAKRFREVGLSPSANFGMTARIPGAYAARLLSFAPLGLGRRRMNASSSGRSIAAQSRGSRH
jgi:hypothetical protein